MSHVIQPYCKVFYDILNVGGETSVNIKQLGIMFSTEFGKLIIIKTSVRCCT